MTIENGVQDACRRILERLNHFSSASQSFTADGMTRPTAVTRDGRHWEVSGRAIGGGSEVFEGRWELPLRFGETPHVAGGAGLGEDFLLRVVRNEVEGFTNADAKDAQVFLKYVKMARDNGRAAAKAFICKARDIDEKEFSRLYSFTSGSVIYTLQGTAAKQQRRHVDHALGHRSYMLLTTLAEGDGEDGVGTAFLMNDVDVRAAKRSLWLPPDLNLSTIQFFPRVKNLMRIDDVADPAQVACLAHHSDTKEEVLGGKAATCVLSSARQVHYALAKAREGRTRAVFFEIVQFEHDEQYGPDQQSNIDNELEMILQNKNNEWSNLTDQLKKHHGYKDENVEQLKNVWKALRVTAKTNNEKRS